MSFSEKKITRRQMFQLAGLAGLASITLPLGVRTAAATVPEPPADQELPQVPRRMLGKTGQAIPILLMGGDLDFNQRFDPRLAEAFRFGVNYFDTADCYANGASETAMGGFLEQSGRRNDLWLTTKSCQHDPQGFEHSLHTSLDRMKTDHIDLLLLHGLKDEEFLSAGMAQRVDQLKNQGKIRFFGFSCPNSVRGKLLAQAATLPWIDAVMFDYKPGESGNAALSGALDACHQAQIGLIAAGSALVAADLTAIWADQRITAVVSQMDTFEKMKANISAALHQPKSSSEHYPA